MSLTHILGDSTATTGGRPLLFQQAAGGSSVVITQVAPGARGEANLLGICLPCGDSRKRFAVGKLVVPGLALIPSRTPVIAEPRSLRELGEAWL